MVLFTQKFVIKDSTIKNMGLGSGIGKNLIRIPDPDPQHCCQVHVPELSDTWIRALVFLLRSSVICGM
jgi:hypothetical protein